MWLKLEIDELAIRDQLISYFGGNITNLMKYASLNPHRFRCF